MPSASQAPIELDVPHQVFAAKMRSAGVLPAKDTKNLHLSCMKFGKEKLGLFEDGFPSLEESVKKCTAVLRDFGYSVCKLQAEESGKLFYAHVRIAKRPWDEAMMPGDDKKIQKFLIDVVKAILDSPPTFSITEFAALQAAGAASVDLARAKDLLGKWVSMAYFERVEGMYSLGPLTTLQYEDDIAAHMPNQTKCELCKKYVFRGVYCRNCPGGLHKHCYRMLAVQMKNRSHSQRDATITCHACRTPYPDPTEDSRATQSTQDVNGTQMSRASNGSD